MQPLRAVLLCLTLAVLSACSSGGGGGGDNGGITENLASGTCQNTPATALLAGIYGVACYDDLQGAGMTTNWGSKPIRYAKVELVDANDNIIDAATVYTDGNGVYEIDFAGLSIKPGKYRVRVLSRGQLASGTSVGRVIGSTGFPYALAVAEFDVDLNTLYLKKIHASNTSIAAAFNVYDQMVKVQSYLEHLKNNAAVISGSLDAMRVQWYAGNEVGTHYCYPGLGGAGCPEGGDTVYLYDAESGPLGADQDGYDDSVILHELGHFVLTHYSKDDSPGGSHRLDETNQDLALSWSEGFATAFQSFVQSYAAETDPDAYLDRLREELNGDYDPAIYYFLEEPQSGENGGIPLHAGLEANAEGMANEIAVSALLWDIFDAVAGEAFDAVSDETGLWDVIVNRMSLVGTDVSFQDFWDKWWAAGYNAINDITSILEDRRVYLTADNQENDNSAAQAKALSVGIGNAKPYTLHQLGDVDWAKVALTQGVSYRVRTQNVLSGADTRVFVYKASDPNTVVASNDNSNSGTCESRTELFTPDETTDYLIKVERVPFASSTCPPSDRSNAAPRYGSYELVVQ